MGKELYKAGLFTEADRTAFARYCEAYARWVEAEKEMRKSLIEFGVMPSGRS
jgi:phage terminase small subunit